MIFRISSNGQIMCDMSYQNSDQLKSAQRDTNLRVGWIKAAQILCSIDAETLLSIWLKCLRAFQRRCCKFTGNGKLILDRHPEFDQHQNQTCSRGSPPAPTHQILRWSMKPFLRYLADKNSAHTQTDTQTDRQTDRQTDTRRWSQYLAAYGAQVINRNQNKQQT